MVGSEVVGDVVAVTVGSEVVGGKRPRETQREGEKERRRDGETERSELAGDMEGDNAAWFVTWMHTM